MKKLVLTLLVLALCAPAMADVTVTGVDMGSGVLRITVSPSGGDTVRGIGLSLSLDAANTGDGVVASGTVTGMNTNIDYIAFNGIGAIPGETPAGEGHPLADPGAAGVGTPGTGDISLCSGYLDPAGTQLGYAVDSFFDVTYTITTDTLVTIDLDTLRGGIVGDIAGAITIATPTVLLEVETVCVGDIDGNGIIGIPDLQALTLLLGNSYDPINPAMPFLGNEYAVKPGDADYPANAELYNYDQSADGIIGIPDLQALTLDLGNSYHLINPAMPFLGSEYSFPCAQ